MAIIIITTTITTTTGMQLSNGLYQPHDDTHSSCNIKRNFIISLIVQLWLHFVIALFYKYLSDLHSFIHWFSYFISRIIIIQLL